MVAVVGLPTWLAVLVLPGLERRWRLLQAVGRLLSRALFIELSVEGAPPVGTGSVLVANHASFVDGIVLFLALPSPVAFVVGGVFANQRVAGPFLRRLGCAFVRRDPEHPGSQTQHLAEALTSGRSLAIFPEGGLADGGGLRPFRRGAFAAAAQAGAPVVPIGIRGTRQVVAPGRKVLGHSAVAVAFGQPIVPTGADEAALDQLRDRARQAVAGLSGQGASER